MRKRTIRIVAFLTLLALWLIVPPYIEQKVYESCIPGQNCPGLAYIDGPIGALVTVMFGLVVILFGIWILVSNPNAGKSDSNHDTKAV